MLHSALEIIDVLDVFEYDDGSYVELRLMSNGECCLSDRLNRPVTIYDLSPDCDVPF